MKDVAYAIVASTGLTLSIFTTSFVDGIAMAFIGGLFSTLLILKD